MHAQKRSFQLLLSHEGAYLSCTFGYRKKPFGAPGLSLSTQQYQFNFGESVGAKKDYGSQIGDVDGVFFFFLYDSELYCQS